MSRQQDIGHYGERLATEFLEHKGYKILASNWRYKRAEVDIIASLSDTIIFIEVKTRTDDYFGSPDIAVNEKKEAMITSAAHAYIDAHAYEGEIRFDIITVLLKGNQMAKIEHLEDAFFWGI